jgi:hypothetical protein
MDRGRPARSRPRGCRGPARSLEAQFSVDARGLYGELYDEAAAEADASTLGWLASAGYGYQALREENHRRVQWMSGISGGLGVLMVFQTLAWLTGLAVD